MLGSVPLQPGSDASGPLVAVAATVASFVLSLALAADGRDGHVALACWVHTVAAFLPTCGLVQHGMIQLGGDRYCYLPILVAAPLAAAAVRALSGEPTTLATNDHEDTTTTHALIDPSRAVTTAPPTTATNATDSASSSRASAAEKATTPTRRGDSDSDSGSASPRRRRRRVSSSSGAGCALAAVTALVVLCCEAQLTAWQVPVWQHDVSLLTHSIRLDPHDWRVLDIYAEYLMRTGDDSGDSQLFLERALRTVELMRLPRNPKEMIFRGKGLIFLGQGDQGAHAPYPFTPNSLSLSLSFSLVSDFYVSLDSALSPGCALFHEAKALYPESSFAHNNAAICDLRHPDSRQGQAPNFQLALELARRQDHRAAAQQNLVAYEAWERNGFQGRYDGTLVY